MEAKRWDHGWDYVTVSFAPGVKDALRARAQERGLSLSAALREGAQAFLDRGPADHPPIGSPMTAPPTPPDTDEAFANWLAGFIDGEGCFMILPVKGGQSYQAVLSVTLRDDDAEILEEICRRVGAGTIQRAQNKRRGSKSNPIARWLVYSKAGVAQLIALLDAHPLRAKKARDYAIWREAAMLWLSYRGDRFNRANAPWDEMRRLKTEMQAGRAYRH